MEEAMMCYQSLQQKAPSMHYIKAKWDVQNGPLASIFYIPLIKLRLSPRHSQPNIDHLVHPHLLILVRTTAHDQRLSKKCKTTTTQLKNDLNMRTATIQFRTTIVQFKYYCQSTTKQLLPLFVSCSLWVSP